jgi:hypothetical protein
LGLEKEGNMTLRTQSLAVLAAAVALVSAGLAGPAAARTPGAPDAQVLSGTVDGFVIGTGDLALRRHAQPQTPFDKVGRRFALLGFEGGGFEAWAYPLKLLRNFQFSFLLGTSTVPIEGRDIVRFVSVEPAVTTLTFTYQSFTVKAHYVAPVDEPGAAILLDVDSTEPLTIVCSFIPVLQPMWPAGLGGQYAYWDDTLKAYLISEPTRKNHGYLGSPAARGISYTPAHMLSDVPNQFKIEIADPKSVAGRFIPIVVAGGKGTREDVKKAYQAIAPTRARVTAGLPSISRNCGVRRSASGRPSRSSTWPSNGPRSPWTASSSTIPTSAGGSSPAWDLRAPAGGPDSAGSSGRTPISTR